MSAPDAGILWQPVAGDSVLHSPFRRFPPDQSIEVYYEVYGLASGQMFETSIAVLESRGGRELPRLELKFSEVSGGLVNRLHRTVRLDSLKKGSYWLEVRVRSANGLARRIRRTFEVTG